MKKNKKFVQQAANLSSSDLHQLLSHANFALPKDYHYQCIHASELSPALREEIIDLFENNMKKFYEQSHDGYQVEDKRNELFSSQSRYILIQSANYLIAFTHFRFDMDYGSRVIYLYELQVHMNYQAQGLGQWLLEKLKILCQKTQMSKIVLTVHKTNSKAIDFYLKKCHFEIDVSDPEDEQVDYQILSCTV